ncbi:MAG: hypothetical protein JNL09_09160 [Anaerolineales bacterium]|nr:hypothetical protein [Anaerolineales bacterium]
MYFDVEVDDAPGWVKVNLAGKWPLDLAVALALIGIVLSLELLGFLQLWSRLQ